MRGFAIAFDLIIFNNIALPMILSFNDDSSKENIYGLIILFLLILETVLFFVPTRKWINLMIGIGFCIITPVFIFPNNLTVFLYMMLLMASPVLFVIYTIIFVKK